LDKLKSGSRKSYNDVIMKLLEEHERKNRKTSIKETGKRKKA
jgi:predicted CopG family antitoxin